MSAITDRHLPRLVHIHEVQKLIDALKQIEEQCIWVDHCKCEPTDPCMIAHVALRGFNG